MEIKKLYLLSELLVAEFGDTVETSADFAWKLDAALPWAEPGELPDDEGEACFQGEGAFQTDFGLIKVVS